LYYIIDNKIIGPDYYKMDIKAVDIAQKANPGQFIQIKVNSKNTYDPLLRRPFSLFDVDKDNGIIKIIYRIVGRGTKIMSEIEIDNNIDILGPLGNGFNINLTNKDIILIGGGMGIVPLFYLYKSMQKNNNIKVLIGAKDFEEIEYFTKIFSDLKYATESNNKGYRGTVLDLLLDYGYDFDYFYACGPNNMLKSLQEISNKNKLNGEISLEKRMGCGTGVCLSCVSKTINGNRRVCKDGPIFSIGEVIFDE